MRTFTRLAGVCLLASACLFGQATHNGDLNIYGAFSATTSPSTKPFTSVTTDPTGACSSSAQMELNTGTGATQGDVSACLNGFWSLVAGPAFTSYTPTLSGGVIQPYSNLLTHAVIDATSFGVSPNNGTNDAQLAAAMAAAFNPSNDGQATPSHVLLPCGTLKFASQIQVPALTDLIGCGRGDSPALIPPKGRGTVLQATGAFSSASFPNNMVVVLGGSGALSSELFGSRLDNLTIDGNNVAGGLMVANCQEMCGADRIQITNVTNYGFFDWGADNNGNTATINQPWGLPANYQGSANDGPYTNIEIYTYGGASASTVPLVLANVAGLRGIDGITIATDNPSQNNGANTPNVCGMIWGSSGAIRNGHCEGPKDGLTVGPWNGAAGQYGDGANQMLVENFQYSTPQLSTGCAVRMQDAKGVTLTAIRGGQTAPICNDGDGSSNADGFFTEDNNINTNFSSYIGTRRGISLDSPITTTSTVQANTLQGNGIKIESSNPCSVVQYAPPSGGSNFPYISNCVNSNGDLIMTSGGGSGNTYIQGAAVTSYGIGLNGSGLNISAPLSPANNVMSVIGNNLTYLPATNQFQTSNNGQSDANGIILDYSSVRIVGNANVPSVSTLTPATVNTAWTSAAFLNTGQQVFGNSGVTGAVTTITDSAGSCVIDPSQGGISCNTTQPGLTVTKNLTGSTGTACQEVFSHGLLVSSTCP